MIIDDQIRDEKLQYDINREAAKISSLSSGETGKYEYLTGEEILPYNQHQIIEEAKFNYSPSGKTLEKQIKTIEDQGEKQIKALKTFKPDNEKLSFEDVIPKNALNNDETIKELDKIKETEKNIDREKLVYKTNKYTYNFKNFQTIKSLGKFIYDDTITLKEADDYQSDLLTKIMNFNKKTKPKNLEKKHEK